MRAIGIHDETTDSDPRREALPDRLNQLGGSLKRDSDIDGLSRRCHVILGALVGREQHAATWRNLIDQPGDAIRAAVGSKAAACLAKHQAAGRMPGDPDSRCMDRWIRLIGVWCPRPCDVTRACQFFGHGNYLKTVPDHEPLAPPRRSDVVPERVLLPGPARDLNVAIVTSADRPRTRCLTPPRQEVAEHEVTAHRACGEAATARVGAASEHVDEWDHAAHTAGHGAGTSILTPKESALIRHFYCLRCRVVATRARSTWTVLVLAVEDGTVFNRQQDDQARWIAG